MMPLPHTAHGIWIGLGSNIDPEQNLTQAAALLAERWPDIRFSSVYASPAQGYTDQPEFLNAAAHFVSRSSPELIRGHLQMIERRLKKNPPFANGPRTIDLDLLLFGSVVLPNAEMWHGVAGGQERTDRLVLPHPRMHLRRFVLEPLREIGLSGTHPVLGTDWSVLYASTAHEPLQRTELRLS